MAGTLLHVTLANRALENADLPPFARNSASKNPADYRLGSVLVDLPYYGNLVYSGLRSVAGLDIRYNPWGTLLHHRAPGQLALALLETAENEPGIHLALGYLTHFAIDVLFHREIQRRVYREADGSRSLEGEHKRIEDEIDAHIHYHFLNHQGIGTPYTRKMLDLRPDPNWAVHTSRAISQIHHNTIDPPVLQRWLAELRAFGLSSSVKWVPWVKSVPNINSPAQRRSLDLAEEAIRLSADYLKAGYAFSRGEIGREDLLRTIGDRSMLDGGSSAPPVTIP